MSDPVLEQWEAATRNQVMSSDVKDAGDALAEAYRVQSIDLREMDAENNRLLIENGLLLDVLCRVIRQACCSSVGICDSCSMSAYADGMYLLAEKGLFQIEIGHGRRVIGQLTEIEKEAGR